MRKSAYLIPLTALVFWQAVENVEIITSPEKCSDDVITYTVQKYDNLHAIGQKFGSSRFWESIYIANADGVNNPHKIFPGQKIKIPYNVANYEESGMDLKEVLDNPFCTVSSLPIIKIKEDFLIRYSLSFLNTIAEKEKKELAQLEEQKKKEEENKQLEEFRKAFEALVAEQKRLKAEEEKQNAASTAEVEILNEIDGMVIDETRSKIGRDFYDVFYTYWQAPPQAKNFSIVVKEQPAPSLGTIISVNVNDTETFKTRLQPRYEMIEEAGKYAVRTAFIHLRQNEQTISIY